MHISHLKESKFLKQEDCGPGILVTCRSVEHINIAKDGAEAEMKYALNFDELEKPLILNSTNGQLIAKITGQEDWDNWTGHKIVLFSDPNVSFGGKLVGGIRCRAPRGQAAKAVASQSPTPTRQAPVKPVESNVEAESDIPF